MSVTPSDKMCTVSFTAQRRGYLLGMNRDEKLSRPKGLAPQIDLSAGRRVVFPSEPGGGTWIALNDVGVTFALINWYPPNLLVENNSISRGTVVNSLAGQVSAEAAGTILAQLALRQINPFRLIGVFPGPMEIIEWRWNLLTLERIAHPWETGIWISSSFNEPEAQHARESVFTNALRQRLSGNPRWLRRLHRSHSPARGPFSICMHRKDASTVSYTEVAVSKHYAKMRYHPVAPCSKAEDFCQRLRLSNSLS